MRRRRKANVNHAMKFEEIAAVLGTSVEAVRGTYNRAMRKIRKQMLTCG